MGEGTISTCAMAKARNVGEGENYLDCHVLTTFVLSITKTFSSTRGTRGQLGSLNLHLMKQRQKRLLNAVVKALQVGGSADEAVSVFCLRIQCSVLLRRNKRKELLVRVQGSKTPA